MRRLLPLLLPARPSCAWGFEAVLPPTTTAPTGRPRRKPGTVAAGVPGVGVTETRGVEEGGREDVRFFKAGDLGAQGENIGAERIERSGGKIVAVVNCVD